MSRSRSGSSIRKSIPVRISDVHLENILAADNDYLDVLTIREEIIENALDECDNSYYKRQSVKFLLSCLHDSYINLFNTIYMYYDKNIITFKENMFKPDTQGTPLPLDNYAEFSLPLEKKTPVAVPADSGPTNLGRLRSFTSAFLESSKWSSNNVEDQTLLTFSDGERVLPSLDNESLYERVAGSGKQEEMGASHTSSFSELFEDIASETSFFTGVAEAEIHFLPHIEQTRCENPQVKVDAPSEKAARASTVKKHVATALPPLRLYGRFKSTDVMHSTTSSMKARSSAFRVNTKGSISTKDYMSMDAEQNMKEERRPSAMDEVDDIPHKVLDEDSAGTEDNEESYDSVV